MTGEEFREMVIGKTEYEATTEHNIVYKALHHARLVHRGWIQQAQEWAGQPASNTDPAAPRPQKDDCVPKIAEYDRDTPDPFSLKEFEEHIRRAGC